MSTMDSRGSHASSCVGPSGEEIYGLCFQWGPTEGTAVGTLPRKEGPRSYTHGWSRFQCVDHHLQYPVSHERDRDPGPDVACSSSCFLFPGEPLRGVLSLPRAVTPFGRVHMSNDGPGQTKRIMNIS
eukprot:3850031-Prymnesium_polylepis.1